MITQLKVEKSLVEKLFQLCQAKGLKIITAESCTGGMLSSAITSVAGSSAYFEQGFITYSNQAKIQLLKVKKALIDEYGAVSMQVAKQMAIGALNQTLNKVDEAIAVSITGIAGPETSVNKPVGLVYIATTGRDNVYQYRHNFLGSREEIRRQSVIASLKHLIHHAEIYGRK
jgi:PncC family amidohydrolase